MADTNNQYNFLDYEGLALFWSNVKEIIDDNELVTATALTDLDTRVDSLEELTSNLVISKTYAELKDLRDNTQLTPGQQYRISDYVTTTIQENTQSAGHPFDVIVTADDESTLNDVARAVQHDEDTYFADSDLNAWQIWYCLDNDTDRFVWANNKVDYVIHVPVSDSMREFLQNWSHLNPSIPDTLIFTWWDNPRNGPDGIGLDFYKATNFKLPADDELLVAFTCGTIPQSDIAFNEIIVKSDGTESPGNCFYYNTAPSDEIINTLPTVINNHRGKGVIYHMIDEFGNDCPYDFKNIQFTHPYDTVTYTDYYYTFSTVIGGSVTDHSLLQGYCYGNTMKEYIDFTSKKQLLNSNIFLNTSITHGCVSNSFGNDCYNNSFGDNCNFNDFGDGCNSNSFGDSCFHNSFGNGCHTNLFGNGGDNNSFSDSCFQNFFGNECHSNSFENSCMNNSFGNSCISNSFGCNCYSNSFGNSCISNSFGNWCGFNSFGNYCTSNSFGNSCGYNSFRLSASELSALKDYIQCNHFDDGCSYNVIWNYNITNSSIWLKNINVNRGVVGTDSSYNYINIDVLNQDYEIEIINTSDGIYTYTITEVADSEVDSVWNKIINE